MDITAFGNLFKQTLKSWVDSYVTEKGASIDDWVKSKLQEHLGAEADATYMELSEGISAYEKNKRDIQTAYGNGSSKEEWLAEKLQNATGELVQKERVEVFSVIQKGLAENLGIELEPEDDLTPTQEVYALEDKMLAKTTSELISARAMQLNEDDEFIDAEFEEDYSEFVERALQSNEDDSLKKLASGALVSLVKADKIPIIPAVTPVRTVAQIACLGVDNAKTLVRVAKKEISLTEGLRIITQNTVSAVFEMLSDASGKISLMGVLQRIPMLGKPLQIVNKVSNALTTMVGTTELRAKVEAVKQRVMPIAREFTQNFVSRTVSMVKNAFTRVKNFLFR